jgi:hypothetical protein
LHATTMARAADPASASLPNIIAACTSSRKKCACPRLRGLLPVKGAYPHGCGVNQNNQMREQAHEDPKIRGPRCPQR